MVKEFPKPREDPQQFSEEFRVIIRACDPGLSDLYQLLHMVGGPGGAQKWMQETGWYYPEHDS